MSDTTNTGEKTLSVNAPSKTLTLNKPAGGPTMVRQNFSHGRSKAVVVEVAKKRVVPGPGAPAKPASTPAPAPAPAAAPSPGPSPLVARAPEPSKPVAPIPTPQPVIRQEAPPPVTRAPDPAPPPKAPDPVPEPVVAKAPEPAAPVKAPEPAPAPAKPVEAQAPVTAPPRPAPAATAAPPRPAPNAPQATSAPARAPAPSGPSGGGRPSQGQAQARPGQAPSGRPGQGGPSGRPGPTGNMRGGMVLRELSDSEKAMRAQILVDSRAREAEDRRRAEDEAQQRRHLEDVQRREREAAETRRREEEERHRREEETRRRAEAEARRRLGDEQMPRSASPGQARGGPITSMRPMGERPAGARGEGGERRSEPRGEGRGPRPGAPSSPGAALAAGAQPGATPGSRFSDAPRARPADDDDDRRRGSGLGAKRPSRPVAPKPERRAGDDRGARGRLTLTNALDEADERARSVAAMRRRVQRAQRRAMGDQPREKLMREVVIPETITIQELANRMSERAVDVIRNLMRQGAMHKITDVIDADTAQLIAEDLGHTVKRVSDSDVEEGLFTDADLVDDLLPRPPVVTIMGHVDHGKTSLLDALRKTNVVSGEAGGITQHIGAYQVTSPLGGRITFIDTPGHAAFTAMRARGAKVTDIVVLVVAADDGVMPQTVEAVSHAKAAKVPMIVAVNKIDKPDANPLRVRTDLLQHDVQVESMGGETLEVEVSAKTGQNLDKLLEAIQLQAEVLDLQANPNRPAEAIVVEARLDRGRGPVATAIVQRGTLKVGDIVVAGSAWGRVRALMNDLGQNAEEAGPAMPVEILGFAGVPEAGDRLAVVDSEARAREVADFRERKRREKQQARLAGARTSLADMMSQMKAGSGKKEFMLVVKGDVQGSVEAIGGALEKLGNDEVGARLLQAGVGAITESDVTLAAASRAVIIGFNVRASREAREAAEREGIEIRYYNIIYNLVDDVKQAMTGLLAPTYREELLGNALILEIFNITKVGKIAGCRVTDGKVERGAGVRLIRDNVVIHEGKLSQLKRFKDDAKEVTAGMECGMSFENYQDMRAGDVIECYRTIEVARTL